MEKGKGRGNPREPFRIYVRFGTWRLIGRTIFSFISDYAAASTFGQLRKDVLECRQEWGTLRQWYKKLKLIFGFVSLEYEPSVVCRPVLLVLVETPMADCSLDSGALRLPFDLKAYLQLLMRGRVLVLELSSLVKLMKIENNKNIMTYLRFKPCGLVRFGACLRTFFSRSSVHGAFALLLVFFYSAFFVFLFLSLFFYLSQSLPLSLLPLP